MKTLFITFFASLFAAALAGSDLESVSNSQETEMLEGSSFVYAKVSRDGSISECRFDVEAPLRPDHLNGLLLEKIAALDPRGVIDFADGEVWEGCLAVDFSVSTNLEKPELQAELTGIEYVPTRSLAPYYPQEMFEEKKEGYVELELEISEKGRVKRVRVVESEGGRDFEKVAFKVAKLWRFEMPVLDGVPQAGVKRHTMHFTLPEVEEAERG